MSKLNIGINFGGVLSFYKNKSDNTRNNIGFFKNLEDSFDLNWNAVTILRKLHNDGHNLYLITCCDKKDKKINTKIRNLIDDNIPDLFKEIHFVKKKEHINDVCLYLGCNVMIDSKFNPLVNISNYNRNMLLLLITDDPKFDYELLSIVGRYWKKRNIYKVKNWIAVYNICSNTSHYNKLIYHNKFIDLKHL